MEKFIYNNKEYTEDQYVIATVMSRFDKPFKAKLIREDSLWYLLHNIERLDGSNPSYYRMEGFNYSWRFSIVSDSLLSQDVVLLGYENETKLFDFDKTIEDFLSTKINIEYLKNKNVLKNVVKIFNLYNNECYNEVKNGFIKFSDDKGKITEMKFGRFLRSYISDVKKYLNVEIFISDSDIEKYHNEFIVKQIESKVSVEILKGEDILKAYNSNNYYEINNNNNRLRGSCMNNKTHLLDIYTKNSDSVQLLTAKIGDQYVCRSLLWKATNGETYMDNVYAGEEWTYNLFESIRIKNNYHKVDKICGKVFINVNTDDIELFPYLDTFMYLIDGKQLSNDYDRDHKGDIKLLRKTAGGYDTV